jgi:hypothetical protein
MGRCFDRFLTFLAASILFSSPATSTVTTETNQVLSEFLVKPYSLSP